MRLTDHEQTKDQEQEKPETISKREKNESKETSEDEENERGEWELVVNGKTLRKQSQRQHGSKGSVDISGNSSGSRRRPRTNGAGSDMPINDSQKQQAKSSKQADSNNNDLSADELINVVGSVSNTKNETNTNLVSPWAKMPAVNAIVLSNGESSNQNNNSNCNGDLEHENESKKEFYSTKITHSLYTISTTTTTATETTSQEAVHNHTLDSFDWPSLSSELLNLSLNASEHTRRLIPASNSCQNLGSEALSDEKEEKPKQVIKCKQSIKWKPLIFEAPKRERKSYRTLTRKNNSQETTTSTVKQEKSDIRARSLDKQNFNNVGNDENDAQIAGNGLHTTRNHRIIKSKSTTYRGFATDNRMNMQTSTTQTFKNRSILPSGNSTYTGQNKRASSSGAQRPTFGAQYPHLVGSIHPSRYGLEDVIIAEDTPLVLSMGTNNIYCTSALQQPHYNSCFLPTPQHFVPHEQMIELVQKQIEYYFSAHNLSTDIYLRKKMDAFGCIPLSSIAAFNRVRALSQSADVIIEAVKRSSLLEMSTLRNDDNLSDISNILVRPRSDPLKWPLATSSLSGAVTATMQLNPDVPEFKPKTTSLDTSCLANSAFYYPYQYHPSFFHYYPPPMICNSLNFSCAPVHTNNPNNNDTEHFTSRLDQNSSQLQSTKTQ